jgi:hypothetical protein
MRYCTVSLPVKTEGIGGDMSFCKNSYSMIVLFEVKFNIKLSSYTNNVEIGLEVHTS